MGGGSVLLVGANRRNLELLAQTLEAHGYRTVQAASLAELDGLLEESPSFGLALVDVSGLGAGVWARCEALHSRGVPYVVVSAGPAAAAAEAASIRHGARAVYAKPLTIAKLLALVRSVMGS